MKSSRQATRKKSFTKTCKNDIMFYQVEEKSKHFVIGSSKVMLTKNREQLVVTHVGCHN